MVKTNKDIHLNDHTTFHHHKTDFPQVVYEHLHIDVLKDPRNK